MKKNTKILILVALVLFPVGCSVCPNQLFVASGVTGNTCCDQKTVVVLSKYGNGQNVEVITIPSYSASPSISPSASSSASVTPSPSVSPSASASPVPSPTPSHSASPVVSPSPSQSPVQN